MIGTDFLGQSGIDSELYTSSDGDTWNNLSPVPLSPVSALENTNTGDWYIYGLVLGVTRYYVSSDSGLTWSAATVYTSPNPGEGQVVVYFAGYYITVGATSLYVSATPDFASYTTPVTMTLIRGCVRSGSTLYVYGNDTSSSDMTAYSSTDGLTWTLIVEGVNVGDLDSGVVVIGLLTNDYLLALGGSNGEFYSYSQGFLEVQALP